MGDALTTTVDEPFADVLDAVRAALGEQGFGVLTEIDLAATLRQKIGYPLARNVVRELGHRATAAVHGASVGRIGTATIGVGSTAADFAEAAAQLTTLRAALEPERQEALRAAFARRLGDPSGPFELRARAWYAVGRA